MQEREGGSEKDKKSQNTSSSISLSTDSTYYSDYSYYEKDCWQDRFVLTRGFKDWYCVIDDDFLNDSFNYFGLKSKFKNFKQLLEIISEVYEDEDSDDEPRKKIDWTNPPTELDRDAMNLFMLLHQRYISSEYGIDDIYDNFTDGVYGFCPRVECNHQHVLPYGFSNELGVSKTYVYCPRCKDIYVPTNPVVAQMDGAAFGPDCAILISTKREWADKIPSVKNCKLEVFGFKCTAKRRRLNREHPDIIAPMRSTDEYFSTSSDDDSTLSSL